MCDYGSQVCCGETYPEIMMICSSGSWQTIIVDTICMLGGEMKTRQIILGSKGCIMKYLSFSEIEVSLKSASNRQTIQLLTFPELSQEDYPLQ